MASYPLPPWLHPVDPVAPFERGVSTGANIAEAQNRIELAVQEMTLRREAEQRAQEAQNIANTRAANDFALRQQAQALKAQQVARQWQGAQRYRELVATGKSPQDAWMEVAPDIAPGTVGASLYHQQALAESAKRGAEIERHNREMEAAALERAEQQASVVPTVTSVTNPVSGKPIPVLMGGGRWQVAPADSDAQSAKALRSISDESLKRQQQNLEDKISTIKDTQRLEQLNNDLLKVKTARSNLVMSAMAPEIPPPSGGRATPEELADEKAKANAALQKATKESTKKLIREAYKMKTGLDL